MMLGLEIHQRLYSQQDGLELLIGELEEQDPAAHAHLRLAIYSDEGGAWHILYGEAVVSPNGNEGPKIDLRRIQAVSEIMPLSDFIARIRRAAESGQLRCGQLDVAIENIFDQWSFNRRPSTNNNYSKWPCLIAEGAKKKPPSFPGPLVASNGSEMTYYEDFHDLIREIATLPTYHGPGDSRIGNFTIIIEDHRARLTPPYREGNELVVKIDGCLPPGTTLTGKLIKDGHAQRRFFREAAPDVRLPISDDTYAIGMAVTTENAEIIDVGYGHLSAIPPLDENGDEAAELVSLAEEVHRLLLNGECASSEFKPWVEPKLSNPKFKEIIRTVVAMANNNGGHLIIGVDDSGDVKLLDGKVFGKFRTQALDKLHEDPTDNERDIEAIRLYGIKIRDEIQKGVNPSIDLRFQTVNLESGKVLLFFIDRGSARPYELADNHEVLVRSNATNRRPTLEERRRLHLAPPQVGP